MRINLPIIFAGFSFGAATGLKATCGDPRVVGQISLGTPVPVEGRTYPYEFLARCNVPKLFVSGDHDPYGPREELERVVAGAAEPKKLVLIETAGHFFEGKLDQMRAAVHKWIAELLPQARTARPL